MLDLDDALWGELDADTPILLKMLEANPNQEYGDPFANDHPWRDLWNLICHQGTVCSASYAAVPHIVRIASLATDPIDLSYLMLPAAIVRGREWPRAVPIPPDLEESYFEAVARLPELIPRVVRADLDEATALAISEAVLILCGHGELGEGMGRMKLNDVKRYWEFYQEFQHLADVKAWKEFSDDDIPIFEEKLEDGL